MCVYMNNYWRNPTKDGWPSSDTTTNFYKYNLTNLTEIQDQDVRKVNATKRTDSPSYYINTDSV